MKNLKYWIFAFVILDLILVFPVMLSYKAVAEWAGVSPKGIPEVFVTLTVEITLLVITGIVAYVVSRLYKGTPFQKALSYIAWGVVLYGIGDAHILIWSYTGVEAFPWFFGPAGSSIAHALGVGFGFILVITGIYKIASARNSVIS